MLQRVRHWTEYAAATGLAVLSCLSGCQHQGAYEGSVTLAQAGSCEEALAQLAAENGDAVKQVSEAAGTASSYAVQGAALAGDAVIWLTTGLTSSAIICLPLLPVALTTGGKICPSGWAFDPKLRDKAGEATATWRASPARTATVMRSVAQCFESRGSNDDLKRSYSYLAELRSGPVYQNIDDHEKNLVVRDLDRVVKKLEERGQLESAEKRRAQIRREIEEKAPKPKQWRNDDDGSRYILYGTEIPADLADAMCASIKFDGVSTWRQPNVKEAAKALRAGMLRHDGTFREIKASTFLAPLKGGESPSFLDVASGEIVTKSSATSLLLCVN